jgi:hypothetical protein
MPCTKTGQSRREKTLKHLASHPAASNAVVVIVAAAAITIGWAASAENSDISIRRLLERTSFTDTEIKDGFIKTAFRAELQFDRHVDRIRKFDEPVRVFVVDRGALDRRADIAAVIADIRAHVRHLDVAMTDERQSANFIVTLVQRADLASTIRSKFGPDKAKQIDRALAPECLSGIGKDASFRIRHAEVILPVDQGEFSFYDCAYEEVLQGLGIINDDGSVPWTMFNDDVQMGFFDVYDQYLVNILYDPRVRPGMTRDEVEVLLPGVLPAVRAWVAKNTPARAAESSPAPATFENRTYAQSPRQAADK